MGSKRLSAEQHLRKRILESVIPEATEGLRLRVFHRGKKIVDLDLGRTHRFYDWASLTKIVFTASASMLGVEKKIFPLESSVQELLPWSQLKSVNVQDLLRHTTGLEAWDKFYRWIPARGDFRERRYALQSRLKKIRPKRPKSALYSDIDFLFLGFVLERVFERDLLQLWNLVQERLELDQAHFAVNNRPQFSKNLYAPTQLCPVRKRILRGEVDDLNTWSLGGVSSHAGLFGTMDDLTKWGLRLRESYLGGRGSAFTPAVARKFLRRAIPRGTGDWTLGFMMPSKTGSSAGSHFSSKSFGHTGWTGTSFWYDPTQDLMALILSNRVYPAYENRRFVEDRGRIHDWIYESVVRP